MRQNFDGTKMGQNRRKIKPRPLCSEYPYQNTLILNTKVQICPVINEPMSLFLIIHDALFQNLVPRQILQGFRYIISYPTVK